MEVKATGKYARISPFKVRDVAREIQGLPVSKALDILTFTPRKAAVFLNKTLKSAIANAENNHNLDVDRLYVAEATVGRAMVMKRWRARARGRVARIEKPFSHLTVIVREREEQI